LVDGTSPGFIPRLSVQLPRLIRKAIDTHTVPYLGPGTAIWSNVHIVDLAALYLLIIRCALSGVAKEGEHGYYFASNGEKSWKELAEGIKVVLEENDEFEGEVQLRDFQANEAAEFEDEFPLLSFASSVETAPEKSRTLGWSPKFGGDSILESIKKDAATILNDLRSKE